MKSNIKYAVIAILIILISGLLYKYYNFYKYDINKYTSYYNELQKTFNIDKTITIKKEILNQDQYKKVNDVAFKDFLTNYKQDETKKERYILYNEKNEILKSFTISKDETYINKLNNVGNETFKSLNKSDILEKYNITNDIELLKQIEATKDKNINFFTNIKEMKEQYFFKYLIIDILPKVESITLIDGDLTGYIFNITDEMKEIRIIKENNQFIFLFTGKYNDKEIEDFLKTLAI